MRGVVLDMAAHPSYLRWVVLVVPVLGEEVHEHEGGCCPEEDEQCVPYPEVHRSDSEQNGCRCPLQLRPDQLARCGTG